MSLIGVWHYSWAIFGCLLNGLLIFVAMFKSPKAIRTYATLIVNFSFTDFVECFFDLFTQTRLIPSPGDTTLVYIFNGACKYISETSCKIGMSFLLHCIPHSVYSLVLSFAYRYYILHHSGWTRRTLVLILIVIYIPSLVQGLTYWINFVERDEILPLATKAFPNYNFSAETGVISGIVDATSITAIYGIVQSTVPFFPAYTIIFILRQKIIKYLQHNTQSMSNETKSVHKQMLRALTFQAFTPIFLGIGVCCYLLIQLGFIQRCPMMEYAVFISNVMMPALSPFTYLLFVRPYKNFCLELFYTITCSKKRVDGTKVSKFDSANGPSQGGMSSRVVPA